MIAAATDKDVMTARYRARQIRASLDAVTASLQDAAQAGRAPTAREADEACKRLREAERIIYDMRVAAHASRLPVCAKCADRAELMHTVYPPGEDAADVCKPCAQDYRDLGVETIRRF